MARKVLYYSNELYHHGILGQKWGERNGPPYPLGSGDHSKREQNAGWKKSLKRNESNLSRNPRNKKALQIVAEKEANKHFKDTTYEPKKKNSIKDKWDSLSDKKKKMIKIGAAVVLSSLAVYGAYRLVNNDKGVIKFIDPGNDARKILRDLTKKELKGKSVVFKLMSNDQLNDVLDVVDAQSYTHRQQIKSISELRKWPDGKNTVDNCVEIINRQLSGILDGKDFQSMSYSEQLDVLSKVPVERTQNCMFCTTAYELNRRGIMCQANDRSTGGPVFQIASMFKITDKNAIMQFRYDNASNGMKRAKSILKAYADNYPNGARGNIIVSWASGGGHSMAWEMIDNKFTIIDAQSGIKYDSTSKIMDILSRTTGDITSVRTDNAELYEKSIDLLNAVMPEAIRL